MSVRAGKADGGDNLWPGEPGYRAQAADEVVSQEDPAVQPDPAQEWVQPIEPIPSEHVAGELRIPQGYKMIEGSPLGTGRSVAVAVSRFNGEITSGLLASAVAELERLGVGADSITIMPVPGAFELPLAALALSKSRRFSCVVALGCVVRGETPHFDYVASETASGVLLAGLETGVPVAFGVLTVDTVEQAEARLEKGAEAARSALEMADAFGRLRAAAGA